MQRTVVAAMFILSVAALLATPARANEHAPAARLTVVPDGEQLFDLMTGETTLPDGGTIIDTETGVELRAAWIRYVEGERIEARDAVADIDAGRISTPELTIDVPALRAEATAGVTLEREGLTVTADAATVLFAPGLVRFDAPTSEQPLMRGAALLLVAHSGDAVLLGPYAFEDGPLTLQDDREDARLQLRPTRAEDGSLRYRAANEVDADLWEELEPIR